MTGLPTRARLCGAAQPAPVAPDLVALLARAAGHPSGVTFVDLREREERLTWAEVAARARRTAAALAQLGIAPGDRVAILLRTGPSFLDAFFGTLFAGAVPVPLYPPVRLGRLDEWVTATARMIAVAEARLVLTTTTVKPLLGEVLARAAPPLGCRAVEGLPEAGEGLARAARPDALALVQFSSGSTIEPKPVALTHDALVAQIASFHGALCPGPDDVLVSWLPLYHDMGLIGGLLGAMAYPGPAVLLAPEHFLARPALWVRAISRHRGTISAAPDFAYAYAAARIPDRELEGVDLSCWRAALDGAEPIAGESLRRFVERFAPHGLASRTLMPVYGLSEAALAVTFTPLGAGWRSTRVDPRRLAADGGVAAGRREVVSVGRPVPGVEVEIRDEHGRVVPRERLGRIFVRSRSVMAGYLGDPEGTARALAGGWLDTGDLGFVRDGELYVHGRAKDVLVVRGANHAPDEIESALHDLPGLRSGCAVAVADVRDDGREALLVLAERSGPSSADPEVVASARDAILAATGVAPDEVILLVPGSLPRTSSGKMRRSEALRRFTAGTLRPPRRSAGMALAITFARSILARRRIRSGAWSADASDGEAAS